jgi:hypothetical protein
MEFFLESLGEAKGPEAGDDSVVDTGEETAEWGWVCGGNEDDAMLGCCCCCFAAADADNGDDSDDAGEFVKIVLSFRPSDILRGSGCCCCCCCCFEEWIVLAMFKALMK